MKGPHSFQSISDVHEVFGLPKPLNPLISLIDTAKTNYDTLPPFHVLNFYKISFGLKLSGRLKYGQSFYDFDEGGLLFAAPHQTLSCEEIKGTHAGFTLLIHPDFFLGFPMAKKIKQFGFFSYAVNEALHLSEQEKTVIISIFNIIGSELNSRIDEFSQEVLLSQVELLLNYAQRFYKRQFITRRVVNNELLQKLNDILEGYFDSEQSLSKGIPTVQFVAQQLNVSPGYLSDMLRSLTGQNTQQHIHHMLIEKAKVKLSTTNLPVSEVAYELGFEHPQSFSKWFKSRTNSSPLDFRRSFN